MAPSKAEKPTMYHSEFVKISPVLVEIKSGLMISKYKKPPEPGAWWIKLFIDGRERQYYCESQQCGEALAAHEGLNVMVEDLGSCKEGTAEIKIVSATQRQGTPAPQRPAAIPFVSGGHTGAARKFTESNSYALKMFFNTADEETEAMARVELYQHLRLMHKCVHAVQALKSWLEIENPGAPGMTKEEEQGRVTTLFLSMKDRGYIKAMIPEPPKAVREIQAQEKQKQNQQ
jgi:hypothetical protein